jgi:hypothetical protein
MEEKSHQKERLHEDWEEEKRSGKERDARESRGNVEQGKWANIYKQR